MDTVTAPAIVASAAASRTLPVLSAASSRKPKKAVKGRANGGVERHGGLGTEGKPAAQMCQPGAKKAHLFGDQTSVSEYSVDNRNTVNGIV